ncbi:MAG: hypothetical protein ACQEW9_12850 [Bacteroidota bacterium]
MNNKFEIDQLEEYLQGTSSPELTRQIQSELIKNEALREELESLKLSTEAIKLAGWKAEIQKVQESFLHERKSNKAETKQVNLGLWLGRIAASLLFLLVGAATLMVITISPESFLESKTVSYTVPLTRGETDISDLENEYRNGNHERVLELVDKTLDPTTEMSFLAAMSALELKEGAQAEQLLKSIETANQSVRANLYQDEVDYYLVKANILTKDYAEVQQRIQKILNDPNHTYRRNVSRMDQWKVKILELKD